MTEAVRPAGGVLRLVDCPIQVTRWWAEGPQRVAWAFFPILVHAAAVGYAAVPLSSLAPAEARIIGPIVVAISALYSVLLSAGHIAGLVVIDLVTAQSGQARRLVELSALTYWSQVVWSVPALAALLVWGGTDDVRATIDITRQLWTLWLIGLHAAVLHVVSGLTVGGAWTAGVFLAAVFFGIPVALTYAAPQILY